MPLRWDPLLVRHLARELDARLAGARARALRLDGTSRTLTLFLREATLAWSLHPREGAPRLAPPADPAPADLAFVGRVRRVRAEEDERVLVVELLPGRGRGARDLVVELLGNQWNALVVERPSGTLRHVLVRRDGPRPARVGLPYTPPAPAPREGVGEPLALERWRALLEPVPPPGRGRALVQAVAWTSPLNAPALVDAHPDPLQALEEGWRLWTEIAFDGRPPSPVLLEPDGSAQPYPWPLPGVASRPAASLLDAFAGRGGRDAQDPLAVDPGFPPALLGRLEDAVEVLERRVTRLQAELDAVDDEEALRALGDLILARFDRIPEGERRVSLTGFDGDEVTVALDPTLAPHANAQAYYERAGKAARARQRLPGLLAEAEERASVLRELLARAQRGEVPPEEVETLLPPGASASTRLDGPTLPYRRYRSSGGLEIRVGRGAKHNDDLTFHHAAPGDVWLHARHSAGAHVVLRWPHPGNPPARDLEEAAVLAALHSRARTSGTVPVDWTLRKYVRKPRGAPPGAVVPDRVKTVMVRPDPTLADRLADEG